MKRYNLKFGTEVHTQDKKVGQVEKLVVSPNGQQVTHLLVGQGMLFKQVSVFPLSIVEYAAPDKVLLSLHSDETANYPTFEKHTVEAGVPISEVVSGRSGDANLQLHMVDHLPQAEAGLYIEENVIRHGVEPDDLLWDAQTVIHGHRGQLGQLANVVVQAADGRLHQLVMYQGKMLKKFLVIPPTLIEQSHDTAIHIAVADAQAEELVEYFNYVPEAVEAGAESLEDGPLIKPLLGDLTDRLAADPRTETAVIELICEGGVVTLAGEVDDRETRVAAAEIVRQHPDVITINNNLQYQN